MPGTPLGYINSIQDPSGALPSVGPAFALALTQGAGKGVSTIRDPTPILNAKAFVWADLGSAPLDLYLKCMMLRALNSGNGTYISLARSSVGADRVSNLGWAGAAACGAVQSYDWDAYGRMVFFPDAPDTVAVGKLAYSQATTTATDPAGFAWGNVWEPYTHEWSVGGTAFVTALNAGRRPGTTYQFIGHGYGGGVAHLFARYYAASVGFSPTLVTRIGAGYMGWSNYRNAGKAPATVDLYTDDDPLAFMPPASLTRFVLGGAGPAEAWFRPQGRQVNFYRGKLYYSVNSPSSVFSWSRENMLSIVRSALDVSKQGAHKLGGYAALLWAQLTPQQQAYNFVYDLHAIEGALTAGGF